METKKYYAVNCHYDMVVTVEVAALNEQDAKEQAQHMANDVSLDHFGECYGTDACIADEGELTEENNAMVEKCRIEMEGNCELVQKLPSISMRHFSTIALFSSVSSPSSAIHASVP